MSQHAGVAMEQIGFECTSPPRRGFLQPAALAGSCLVAPSAALATISGSARGFNAEQVRRAQSVLAFAEEQKGGNTGVLYQVRGGLQALG